jgi:AcrR family transcriptional regulator
MPKRYTATDFDRGRVAAMAAAGMQEDRIAKHLGIAATTLRRHYREQLDHALTNRIADIADNLTNTALTARGMPGVVASIFLLKCLGKLREVNVVSHENADGSPVAPARTLQIVLPHNNRGTELAAKMGLLREAAPPLQLESEAVPIGRK